MPASRAITLGLVLVGAQACVTVTVPNVGDSAATTTSTSVATSTESSAAVETAVVEVPRPDVVPDLVGMTTAEFMARQDEFTIGFADWFIFVPGENGPQELNWMSRAISGLLPEGVITATWPPAGAPFPDGPHYDDCLNIVLDDAMSSEDLARGWAFYPSGSDVVTASKVGRWPQCQPQDSISILSAETRDARSIFKISYFVDQINTRPATHYCIVPNLRWGLLSPLEDHPVGCTEGVVPTGQTIGRIDVLADGCSGSTEFCHNLPNQGAQRLYGKINDLNAGDPHEPWLAPAPDPLCQQADRDCGNVRERRP